MLEIIDLTRGITQCPNCWATAMLKDLVPRNRHGKMLWEHPYKCWKETTHA